MAPYTTFIGIDIGKFSFVVTTYGHKQTNEFDNTSSGIKTFLQEYKRDLHHQSLCILETTGGFEMLLLFTLCDQGLAVHRANTRKVKNFIRSLGNDAKTDKLDAKALATYGFERSTRLETFVPPAKQALTLFELVQRRHDLKQMLVAEQNRLKAPRSDSIADSCQAIITALKQQIEIIMTDIQSIIEQDEKLQGKRDVLQSIPGIGEIISHDLLALLPELGSMNRRQISSLTGLAPKANDSGKYRGYRAVGPGRATIKPILFMAAMSARRSHSRLKDFYENLIKQGKKKMVAMVALMRKIIVIANAKIRDLLKGVVVEPCGKGG